MDAGEIVDSLEDLGYGGSLLDSELLAAAVEEGPRSIEFTKLVEWLTTELCEFLALEDHVRAVSGPEDAETFLMELSGFLREFGCPYKELSEGPVTQRLASTESKFRLLNYLATELQAMRMLAINKPHLIVKPDKPEQSENPAALLLKQMLMALSFPKPPDGISPFVLFNKVETKIKDILSKIELAHLSRPLLKARLSDKQWESVLYVSQALNIEYELRRQMLVKRLEVTIQSFLWSDRAKKKDEQIEALYNPVKGKLMCKVDVDLAFLLAAREDLLKIEKTSGGLAREKTKCKLNQVLIGTVPDRGGRAYELEPPPPEMPSFQQRQQHPQPERDGGGRGGRGHGDSHHRGGERVRGGWSDSRSSGGQSSWGQNPVSYGTSQQDNPAAAFYGGDSGRSSYGPPDSGRGAGYRQDSQHHYSGYEGYQQGGYQQGGYQQGGYQQGGYQQGGYQQGGYQQGGYQQGGYQQGGYQQGGFHSSDGHHNGYRQDRQGGNQQGQQDYQQRGGGRGQSGGRGGGGGGGGGRGRRNRR